MAPCGHTVAPMGTGGPVPLVVPRQGGSGAVRAGVLFPCQPCTADAHLLEPTWLSTCSAPPRGDGGIFSISLSAKGSKGAPGRRARGLPLLQTQHSANALSGLNPKPSAAGGFKVQVGPWGCTSRALHSGPLPRPEVPVPWMERPMPRHEAGQHAGGGGEANVAAKADALGSPSPGVSQLADDGRCPFEASHLFQQVLLAIPNQAKT